MIKRFWFIILLVFVGLGCASTHKTTTTETTVTTPNKGMIFVGQPQSVIEERSETTTTSTTTTEAKTEHPGVLSSTLHAIGYVISLPFIIIGGLFRIIFGG